MKCLYWLVCFGLLAWSKADVAKLFDTDSYVTLLDADPLCDVVAAATEYGKGSTIYVHTKSKKETYRLKSPLGHVRNLVYHHGIVYAVVQSLNPPYNYYIMYNYVNNRATYQMPGTVSDGLPIIKVLGSDILFIMTDKRLQLIRNGRAVTDITNVPSPVHKANVSNKDTYIVAGPDRQAYFYRGSDIQNYKIMKLATFKKIHNVNRVNDFYIRPDAHGSVLFATDHGVYYLENYVTVRKFDFIHRVQAILMTKSKRVYCIVDNKVLVFYLDGRKDLPYELHAFTERENYAKGEYFTNMFLNTRTDIVWFTTRQAAVYKQIIPDGMYVEREFHVLNVHNIYSAAYDHTLGLVYVLTEFLTVFFGDNTHIDFDVDSTLSGKKSLYVCSTGGFRLGQFEKVSYSNN